MRLGAALLVAVVLGSSNASGYAKADGGAKPRPQGVFSSHEVKGRGLDQFPNWVGVLDKIRAEEALYKACDADPSACKTPQLRSWRAFLKQLKAERGRLSDLEVLRKVNAYSNRWPYKTDDQVWGRSDYWASPMEFMTFNGDCEDFAIHKYVSLKALGFDESRLRLVIVRDTLRQIGHAVLAVYPKPDSPKTPVYILDSLITEVLPDSGFKQYDPYYSLNADNRWIHIPAKPAANLLKGD
jgi:predicted transglutaminase-like cysteine proteinase